MEDKDLLIEEIDSTIDRDQELEEEMLISVLLEALVQELSEVSIKTLN